MAVDKRSNRAVQVGDSGEGPLTSIELFTGTGGLAEGLHHAGFRHLVAVELYPRACVSLRMNRATRCEDPASVANSVPAKTDRWPLFEGKVQDVDFVPFADKVDVLA